MFDKLESLFKGGRPSVCKFKKQLKSMSETEQQEYYRCAYCMALCNWMVVNDRYRDFLNNLVQNDRQAFLDYLKKETILGQLSCPLTNVALFIKWMNLWKESQINYKVSNVQFSFSLLLAFDIRLKHKVLSGRVATCHLDTDELVELLKYVRLANTDDC